MPFHRLILVLILLASAASGLAGTLAQFGTPFGNIEVELYDQDKPATVRNFIRYVQDGLYTNEFSHRLVPGFVLQAGGYTVTNRGSTNWAIMAVPAFPPVTNEFNTGKFYSNVFGTLAMAKTADPNSATSEFFFNLADNSTSLDDTNNSGGFTVFGHVVAGTNILAMFNNFQYWTYPWATLPQPANLVLYQYYTAPFDTLPLLYPAVTDTNLLFMDVSLLNVRIAPGPGRSCALSWNSIAGMTNYVEFSTNYPPVWQLLCTTNGNGNAMQTTASTAGHPACLYRVRVAN